jgi:tetratricopeptide (TPR) repeat protein
MANALNGDSADPRGSGGHRRLWLLAGVSGLVLIGVAITNVWNEAVPLLLGASGLILLGGAVAILRNPFRDTPKPPGKLAPTIQKSDPTNPGGLTDKELADYKATASLAAIYFDEKNYQSALEMLKQLNTSYPISKTFPYYSTLRAQCLYQLGRPEEAHAELRRGLLGKHLDLASFSQRMKLWDVLGDLAGAEAEVTRVIEESSPITLHYASRARLRLRLENFDGAEKDIFAASTLDDDPGRVGMADKLRAGYGKEFPEYARYLAERGSVPKPEKTE